MTGTARVITVSDRSAAGVRPDASGPILVDGLRELGFAVDGPYVVSDDPVEIESALRAAVATDARIVLTTGGTGLAPRDVTPETTLRVVDRLVPGIAELLRGEPRDRVPTSVLSRGVVGLAGATLIVNLPGSTGGARDGIRLLGPLLPHILEQLAGGDHG